MPSVAAGSGAQTLASAGAPQGKNATSAADASAHLVLLPTLTPPPTRPPLLLSPCPILSSSSHVRSGARQGAAVPGARRRHRLVLPAGASPRRAAGSLVRLSRPVLGRRADPPAFLCLCRTSHLQCGIVVRLPTTARSRPRRRWHASCELQRPRPGRGAGRGRRKRADASCRAPQPRAAPSLLELPPRSSPPASRLVCAELTPLPVFSCALPDGHGQQIRASKGEKLPRPPPCPSLVRSPNQPPSPVLLPTQVLVKSAMPIFFLFAQLSIAVVLLGVSHLFGIFVIPKCATLVSRRRAHAADPASFCALADPTDSARRPQRRSGSSLRSTWVPCRLDSGPLDNSC